jgi:hypothetical protein
MHPVVLGEFKRDLTGLPCPRHGITAAWNDSGAASTQRLRTRHWRHIRGIAYGESRIRCLSVLRPTKSHQCNHTLDREDFNPGRSSRARKDARGTTLIAGKTGSFNRNSNSVCAILRNNGLTLGQHRCTDHAPKTLSRFTVAVFPSASMRAGRPFNVPSKRPTTLTLGSHLCRASGS